MREIKFRARGKDSQWRYFTLPQLMSTGYTHDELINWSEFTGLKDKNGKEIYEGDRVKVQFPHSYHPSLVGEIVFDEGCWVVKDDNETSGNWLLYADGLGPIEVIGNIYEEVSE